jgi:hypothetical protein
MNDKAKAFLDDLDELLLKHMVTINVDLVTRNYAPQLDIELWDDMEGELIYDFNDDNLTSMELAQYHPPITLF